MASGRPMSSIPPESNDYNPLGPQDRSDREHLSGDQVRKRRRIGVGSESESTRARNMTDPSRPPPNVRRPAMPLQHDYTGYPLTDFAPATSMSLPVGTFLEEDAALEYLASNSGFTHDLHGYDFAQSLHHPISAVSDSPPQTYALTSHPSQSPPRPQQGYTPFRPSTEGYFTSHIAAPSREYPREGGRAAAESSTRSVNAVPFPFEISTHPYRAPPYHRQVPVFESTWPPPRRTAPVADSDTSDPQKKPPTMLILSRASAESIEALDDHKRECPTCCLELEPDNFVALITCCNLSMHARCLSAWVNSQSYSRNKACMKCRRAIDAKYMLNKVIPPVSDKDWDESFDFNAPESLKADTRIELNVTFRPRSSHRSRHAMSFAAGRGGRHAAHMGPLTPEQRVAALRLQDENLIRLREARDRLHEALEHSDLLSRIDHQASQALVDAQSRTHGAELATFIKHSQETRVARDVAREAYERAKMELEAMGLAHRRRMLEIFEGYQSEREPREREVRNVPRPVDPQSGSIPVPARVVISSDLSSSPSP